MKAVWFEVLKKVPRRAGVGVTSEVAPTVWEEVLLGYRRLNRDVGGQVEAQIEEVVVNYGIDWRRLK